MKCMRRNNAKVFAYPGQRGLDRFKCSPRWEWRSVERLSSEFLFGYSREIGWLPTCDQRERVLHVTLQSSRSRASHCARVKLLSTRHHWEHIKGKKKGGGGAFKMCWALKGSLFIHLLTQKTHCVLIVEGWKTASIGNSPDRREIIIAHRHCWADTTIQAIKGQEIFILLWLWLNQLSILSCA